METVELLQHATQIQSLDISHIISKHFGACFTSDCVDSEIMENLIVSQGSSDDSHVEYVTELIKITSERQKFLDENKFVKDHILWAQNESLKDDEKLKEENKDYEYLNLPTNESTFFKYINNELLRRNGLIAPEDVLTDLKVAKVECIVGRNSIPEINQFSENETRNIDSIKPFKSKDYRLPPIDNVQSNEKSYKKSSNKNKKPIDMVLATEKDENRFMLDMMAAKNNYLKNPRHLVPDIVSDSKSFLVQTNNDVNPLKMFLPIPEIVEFSDYEVGKVYEKTINFRNITKVLRNIRVLPPRTRYFSLGLGQFPSEKGLIAAGISCQYAIRFAPDSLGDYEDEIIVETQGGNGFSVKIIGKRPRPIFTGSNIWNMNFCFIYGLKIVHYKIKNIGGSGKFCIVDANVPPVSNSKAIIHSFQTVLEPFVIRPSHFELTTNESINLELIFCPNSLEYVQKEFIILCDNCHSESFKITGTGEMAMITVESIEGGTSLPNIDESSDISAQMLIKFKSLNPFTYCQKTIVLKNESHNEIPFSWKIVKPNLKIPSIDSEVLDSEILKNRTLDFDSAFVMEPPFGIFPPNECLPFTLTFAPLEVKSFHSVFHLVLQGIPDFKHEQTTISSIAIEGISKQKSFVKSEESSPEISTNPSSPNHLKIGSIILNDVTSLEIEVKGICIPLKVRFNTPSIIIPGELLINTPVRKQLQIINESMCPISLIWEKPDSEDYIFEVEPKLGLIDAEEIGIVDVCIVANKPGFFRNTLLCHVETLEYPLELIVEANFKGPELDVDIDDLDFGLVRTNETVIRVLKLYNKCSINCSWRTRIGGTEDTELFDEIKIYPNTGILGPLKTQKVNISFTPKSSKSVDCGLEITLENGSNKCLNLLACVQSPRIVLVSTSLEVSGKLFVNAPSIFTITMKNQSHLSSSYKWQTPVGKEIELISILTDPCEGIIEPNGQCDIRLTVTCSTLKEITDLFLPCLIEGVEEPICLNICGMVFGPSFNYSIFDNIESAYNEIDDSIHQSLNFGNNVPIFKDVKKYLLLENKTSIVTNFFISTDYFKATSKTDDNSDKRIRKPNLADRQSKPDKLAHFDHCKSMLELKRGLAIDFTPSNGKLMGYEKIIIQVTAYNDMWGQYDDFVKISGHAHNVYIDEMLIPLNINVVGIPIEFTMTARREEQKPILRLGSKPFGEEPFSRKIRLNNKSCCDLHINWEMYGCVDKYDDKLLDVIVNFGDPFPIIDYSIKTKEMILNTDSERSVDIYNASESMTTNSTRLITDRNIDPASLSDRYQENITIETLLNDLISLVIRPHDGIPTKYPISFQPEQLHIPAESFGYVTISFNPQHFENIKEISLDDNDGISFENFLLGYLSLNERNLQTDNRIMRNQHYEVDQVKLNITGRILLPSLQVDYPDTDEREEIFFSVPFSSLLVKNGNDYSLCKRKTFSSYATLRNIKDIEIKYSLKTRSPFELSNGKYNIDSELKIGDGIKINLNFVIDKEQLGLLKDENLYNHNDSHCLRLENQLLPNELHRTAKMVQFRDVIYINYKNTKIDQLIPIRAQIFFPEFIVSKSLIDFKTCFVGETSCEHLRVINKSKSASLVYLKIINSTESVFNLSSMCSLIESPDTDENSSHLSVSINFVPKQALEYNATLLITGIMGEVDLSIPIMAKGSYDNKYQKKY